MRYPSSVDVNLVLRHALHMLNPKQFDYPSNAFNCVSFTNDVPPPEPQPAPSQRTRTNSESSQAASGSHIDRQISYMQARNAAHASALAKLNDVNRVAMDGYLENVSDNASTLRLCVFSFLLSMYTFYISFTTVFFSYELFFFLSISSSVNTVYVLFILSSLTLHRAPSCCVWSWRMRRQWSK